MGTFVKLFGETAIACLVLTSLLSQDSTLQIGYGKIEPEAGSRVAAVALYRSSNAEGVLLWEAAVGAVEPMERGRVYVEETSRTRTALALANPGDQALELTGVLRDRQGAEVDRQEVTLAAGTQTARFVDEWFEDALAEMPEFLGTLTVTSGDPEARFAAVTLRENVNHRGEPIYATLPVADLDAVATPSSIEDVRAFPQVGGGGGLTTQLVLMNPTPTTIEGRVELFRADGSPLLLSLDGVETSEVPFSLQADGVFRAELTSAAEVRSGYAVLSVDDGSALPAGTAIFQIKSGDRVITEAGVPATVPTHQARMLVDNLGTRTGVAVAPLGDAATPVRFELKEIDGTALSSVETVIGEVGHARNADEIFADLRPGFLGILEVSCEELFAAVTLKLTTNSRGEPVLTTLPVADLSNPPDSSLQVIPQIGLGAGLETRLIVLGAEASNGARGRIDFVSFDSTVMEIPVFGTPQSSVAFEIGPGGGWRFDPTTPLEVSNILLDREISLVRGDSVELSPVVVDNQGIHHTSVPLQFQSTRPDVVSVSTSGTLVGRKAGFATLVVSAGDVVRSTAVTVVEATSGLTGYTINHVEADSSGKLYLSSTPNQVILEAQSFEATPETYAGINQRAGYHDDLRLSALFDAPSFVALDRNTNTLYVSDGGNGKVRTVSPGAQGAVATLEMNGPSLGTPQGLALDDEGYLWVADSANHTIGRIDLETNDFETVAGQADAAGDVDGTATQARFHSPHGLAVERESTLRKLEREARGEPPPPTRILVADTGNSAIRRISRTSSDPGAPWQVETITVTTPNVATRKARYRLQQTGSYFTSPTGISVDAAGNIYVSDSATGEVSLILPSGNVVPALPAGTSTEGVTVTTSGQLLVADGEQGAREVTYAPPEIQNVLRTPIADNQDRITIVGRNFASESKVLFNDDLIDDLTVVDSEKIAFVLPAYSILGATVRVQNRGGQARFTVPIEDVGPLVPASVGSQLIFLVDTGVRLDAFAPDALRIHSVQELTGITSTDTTFITLVNQDPDKAVTLKIEYFNDSCLNILDFLLLLRCNETVTFNPMDFVIPSTTENTSTRIFGPRTLGKVLIPITAESFGSGRFALTVTAVGWLKEGPPQYPPPDVEADLLFPIEVAEMLDGVCNIGTENTGSSQGLVDGNLNVCNATPIIFNHLTGFESPSSTSICMEDRYAVDTTILNRLEPLLSHHAVIPSYSIAPCVVQETPPQSCTSVDFLHAVAEPTCSDLTNPIFIRVFSGPEGYLRTF